MSKKLKISKCLSIFILLTFFNVDLIASNNQIKDVKYETFGQAKGKITILFSQNVEAIPALRLIDKTIQLSIDKAYVWPIIEKKISIAKENSFDSTLMAYQYNKNIVRFRAMLPFEVDQIRERLNISKINNRIEIIFPTKLNLSKQEATYYNEKYLEQLLKKVEKTEKKVDKEAVVPINNIVKKDNKIQKKQSELKIHDNGSKINIFSGYLAKFFAFLVVVLLLFYFIIYFLKKGFFSKNKLGLLNSGQLIHVLSNNYIAPKRSLITVKVHNQVFLLANSERGITFLSEIKDIAGLIKNGEKKVGGKNFDSILSDSDKKNLSDQVKLKESDTEISEVINSNDENSKLLETKKLKYREQVKKKLKNLRSLQ